MVPSKPRSRLHSTRGCRPVQREETRDKESQAWRGLWHARPRLSAAPDRSSTIAPGFLGGIATYSGRSSTSRRGAATRERIIDVAADLFASRGIEAVTLPEILERAGQSNESAIHYYLGSREGLLAAIFRSPSDAAAAREEFLRELEARGDAISLEQATAALVIPLRQAMKSKWGRDYIRLAAQVIRSSPESGPGAARGSDDAAGPRADRGVPGRPARGHPARAARRRDHDRERGLGQPAGRSRTGRKATSTTMPSSGTSTR